MAKILDYLSAERKNTIMTQNKSRSWFMDAVFVAAIIGLLLVMFHFWGNTYAGYSATITSPSLFAWLAERWDDSALSFGGNYSHGWLVPLISLWLLWRRKQELMMARQHLWPTALPFIVASLLMHWMGTRGELPQLSALGLITLLWSIPAFLWGRTTGKLIFFPLVYLVFAVPLNIFDSLTFPLRMLASVSASTLLNGLGIPVTRIGTALHSTVGGGFHLEVADPCSGIRSLTAMMAVAAAYAYITQKTSWRRWTLFLSSIPLAVVGNTVRLLTVGVVAAFLGTELAVGVYHDYSGYIFYAVTLSALLGIERAMSRRNASWPPASIPAVTYEQTPSSYRPPLWSYLTVVGMTSATLAVLIASGKPTVDPRLPLRNELPQEVAGWKGTDILFCQAPSCLRSFPASELTDTTQCPSCSGKLERASYAELQILPADTHIIRKRYQHSTGNSMTVTIVFSGQGRSSLHRPEICLPSQGFTIANHSLEPVPMKGRHPLTVSFLTIEHRLAGAPVDQQGLFCYWFTGGRDRETPSHIQRILWMAEDRILRNTSTRWAYVSVLMTPGHLDANSKAEMIHLLGTLAPLLKP